MTPAILSEFSLVAIYSAIAIYVLAFVAFTLDLSARSARAIDARRAAEDSAIRATAEGARVLGGGSGSSTTVLERPAAPPAPSRRDTRFQRIGTALTIIAWVVHVAGTVMRGLANGHVPWSNMYEFAMVGTVIMIGVFLSSMATMEGGSPKQKLETTWWPALKANWMVWPAVQFVNFSFLPLQYRLFFANIVSIGWNSYLSWVNSQ